MPATKSVVFALVSLVCTVNATRATGKPVLAKRQAEVTVTSNGCTATCVEYWNSDLGIQCDVYCDGSSSTKMPPSTPRTTLTSTATSTVTHKAKATLNQRSVVSTNTGACHQTCSINEAEGDFDCYFACDVDFSTAMPVALQQRTAVSAVQDDCTAVCWDLMPGTECDVQCSSDFKTEMPVGFAEPSKAARIANLEARENVQARRVHEARLSRKFGGVVARDDSVPAATVTSIHEDCTTGSESSISTTIAGMPAILPLQVPQAAEAPAPSALSSQASAAISAAQQVLPTFASAESKVESLLSSMIAATPTSATATPVATTTMAISTALKTTTASATSIETSTESIVSSVTTTALATVSEIYTALATSPKTITVLATVSETTTVAATSPKKTTAVATSSETTTESDTSSETTTKSATVSKTTTKSATASETTTESATASETVTSSTTSSETITASTTTTGSLVVSELATTISTSFPITGAASGHTVSTGLVISILVGLAANVVFLI